MLFLSAFKWYEGFDISGFDDQIAAIMGAHMNSLDSTVWEYFYLFYYSERLLRGRGVVLQYHSITYSKIVRLVGHE